MKALIFSKTNDVNDTDYPLAKGLYGVVRTQGACEVYIRDGNTVMNVFTDIKFLLVPYTNYTIS